MKKYKEKRPWGGFEQFTLNEKSTVKILTVKSKQAPSLQTHKNRAEFWRILEGTGKATVGNRTIRVKPGDELMIKKKQKHTVEATKTLKILEISFGKFDEKDIIRIKDKYGRA